MYSATRLFLSMALGLIVISVSNAQYRIIGFVYDAQEQPFAGVEVRLTGQDTKQQTFTDPEGRFEFHDVARGEHKVLVITQYGLIERKLNIRTSLELHLQQSRTIKLDNVEVYAVRADPESPIAKTMLEREDIEPQNLALDMPYLLQWTPSTVVTSDAGTGIGYTGIRVRGVDPTRINVTINGVPLNDAESQGVFWVDLPDFATSVESIQLERGVGSSTFGTGAFGGSIHLNTNQTHVKPYGQIAASAGSFGTYKVNASFGSGLIGNHFTIDGRLSTIQSDGYIDRATADLRGYFGSAAYIAKKGSLRFTAFGGNEVTYQAWNGVPAQYIDDPELRTFNTAGTERPGDPYENEVDNYTQNHYQLHWNQSIFTQLQSYVTLFYTRGKGYFEQYKTPGVYQVFEPSFTEFLEGFGLDSSDVIRRLWLDNHFFGAIAGLQFVDPSERYDVRLSGGMNRYNGRHFGEVIEAVDTELPSEIPNYYDNDATKISGNIFLKVNYKLTDRLTLLTDLQYRGLSYEFVGPDRNGMLIDQEVKYRFFNPKLGLTFRPVEEISTFVYAGIANREPNREDFISSSPDSRPRSERLYDIEAGGEWKKSDLRVSLRGYYMIYDDQLVLTGRLNDVGEYTRVNVDNSYRLGIEAEVDYAVTQGVQVGWFGTFSRNKVREYDEFIDNWDYDPQGPEPPQFVVTHENTDLAFSPSVVTGGRARYDFIRSDKHEAFVTILGKYVGDQYVDNSGREASIIDGYFFSDLELSYTWNWTERRSVRFNLLVRNIFNARYETNAWNYRFRSAGYNPVPDDPYVEREQGDLYHQRGYFPQAGRNFLAGVTISF